MRSVFLGVALLLPWLGCTPCEESFALEFELESSGTDQALHSVLALFDGEAIAVGAKGTILARGPDGRWARQASGVQSTLFAVDWSDSLSSAKFLAVGDGGMILRNEHSGRGSWDAVQSGVNAPLHAVAFGNDTTVIAVGESAILRSEDEGQSWTPVALPEPDLMLRAVAFLDSRFLAVGDAGSVLLSVDSGASWRLVDVPTSTDLLDVGVGSNPTGADSNFRITGKDGTALQMLDKQGREWEPARFPIMSSADVFVSRPDSWIVGSDWSVYNTDRGDGPYFPDPLPSETIHEVDGDGSGGEAWIVGDAGMIVHLTTLVKYCPFYD